MPDLWMPGARKYDIGNHAPCDGGPAKAIAHITWDGVPVRFSSLFDYFTINPEGRPKAPHILWDPITGEIGQFLPANSRSFSVRDLAGGTRTNRAGSVVIQIEAILAPGKTRYEGRVCNTLLDTPCKNWDRLNAWVRSWGVPDRWPGGMPNWRSDRSAAAWAQAGWFGHSQVPENTHTDPGPWPAFVDEEEDGMALSEEQVRAIVREEALAGQFGKGDRRRSAGELLVDAADVADDLAGVNRRLDAVEKALGRIEAKLPKS